MKEYEYNLKVKSVEPYIKYCESNKYTFKGIFQQNRIVYENNYSKDIIARITTTIENGRETCFFDCKNFSHKDSNLQVAEESLELEVTSDNREQIESILKVLNFYQSANNTRNRYIYQKKDIKFEIDDYTSPPMCIVGIEGKKEMVDKVYSEIKNFDK